MITQGGTITITTATTRSGTATVPGTTDRVRAGAAGTSIRTGPTIRLDRATSRTTAAALSEAAGATRAIIAWCHTEIIKVSSRN